MPELESILNQEWLIWQLADSAFPTGGFAHSGGLEAAMHHGEVLRGREFEGYAESNLVQAGRSLLPFALAAHGNPHRITDLDDELHAMLSNPIANRASRLQGRALVGSVERIFKLPADVVERWRKLSHGHLAPLFGAVMSLLGIGSAAAGRLLLFQHLRGLVSAAVRLGIAGPMEAQAVQNRLSSVAEQVYLRCRALTPENAAQACPIAEIWQLGQDRLYSRLFQS